MATGEDDTEFDFKFFRWHRYENRSRAKHSPRKTPWAAEALLDLGTWFGSGVPSRANSPPSDARNSASEAVDAGAVAFGSRSAGLTPLMSGSNDSTANLAIAMGYPSEQDSLFGPFTADSSLAATRPMPSAGSQSDLFAIPDMPQHFLSASSLLEQRRWADLDYQWDGQGQFPLASAFGGSASSGIPAVGDDFSRFLEQAGYAVTDDTDPVTWTSRPD